MCIYLSLTIPSLYLFLSLSLWRVGERRNEREREGGGGKRRETIGLKSIVIDQDIQIRSKKSIFVLFDRSYKETQTEWV